MTGVQTCALPIYQRQTGILAQNRSEKILEKYRTDKDLAPIWATKKPEESAISQPEKPTVKAIIPKTIKVIEPTAPGGPPSEPDIPLGGSTGALKNL